MSNPLRGEIWMVDLNPTRGREQRGKRPALVVSTDLFNEGPAGLVIVLPVTSKDKRIPFHVPIDSPEGGVKCQSFIKCEDVRSVSKDRFSKRWGTVSRATMDAVADRMRILLEL